MRILRLEDVKAVTGLARSTIYALVARGTFPAPVPLGERARGWREDEVNAWIEARTAERDGAGA